MEGRRYRLRAGANTLGRQGTDVLVNDNTVSRLHARLTVEGDTVIIEDLGSTNGTKVGDTRLGPNEPATATNGTPLKFGNWQVTLEVAGDGAAVTPAPAERTVALTGEEESPGAEPPSPSTEVSTTPEPAPEEIAEPARVIVAMLKKTDGPAADIPIFEETITVGRKPANTVALPQDPYISGSHAVITTDNTGTYLTDLGSTNGTLVNGQKLTPSERQLLLSGDEVQMGQTTYTFTHVETLEEALPSADVNAEGAGLESES